LVEKSNFTYAGIGLNIENDVYKLNDIAVSLKDFVKVSKEEIFWEILEEEGLFLDEFLANGFKIFVKEYQENLAILNEKVKVDVGSLVEEGIVVGVGSSGELI